MEAIKQEFGAFAAGKKTGQLFKPFKFLKFHALDLHRLFDVTFASMTFI